MEGRDDRDTRSASELNHSNNCTTYEIVGCSTVFRKVREKGEAAGKLTERLAIPTETSGSPRSDRLARSGSIGVPAPAFSLSRGAALHFTSTFMRIQG
jgi:hypothetical protein